MRANRKYQVKRTRLMQAMMKQLHGHRRLLHELGELHAFSGDPFMPGGGSWPKFGYAIRLYDRVPGLTVIRCIEVGGQPHWFDPDRPGLHNPEELGLVGFWDSSRDHADFLGIFKGLAGQLKHRGAEWTDAEIQDAAKDIVDIFGPDLGNFVTYAVDKWISDMSPDSMLERISAVIDMLLGGRAVNLRADH